MIADLPKEYRTPQLESLPEGLQAVAEAAIRKKFNLGPATRSRKELREYSGWDRGRLEELGYPVEKRIRRYKIRYHVKDNWNGREIRSGSLYYCLDSRPTTSQAQKVIREFLTNTIIDFAPQNWTWEPGELLILSIDET